MKHKVTCMDCGRTEIIEVERGKPPPNGWQYFGKLNVNTCQTSKYFLRPIDQKNICGKCEKIPNECYDPKVKPKYAEMWVCPNCGDTPPKLKADDGKHGSNRKKD